MTRALRLSMLAGFALAWPSLALAQPDGEPPGPHTVRTAGNYRVVMGNNVPANNGGNGNQQGGPEARILISSPTEGTMFLNSRTYALTADPVTDTLKGVSTGGNFVNVLNGNNKNKVSRVSLRIVGNNVTNKDGLFLKIVTSLVGTLDDKPITLVRRTETPIPASELADFDPGPQGDWKTFFDSVPDYTAVLKAAGVDPKGKMFWYNFGPVFYRGRLDGTARVMVIASDPGPEECLPFVRHPMVGDAGQRVQGFLAKLGIDRSYVLVNAYAYAMRPSFVEKNFGKAILTEDFSGVDPPLTLTPEQMAEVKKLTAWRHEFFTRVARTNKLEAIVPMGGNAGPAYALWIASLAPDDPIRKIPVFKVQHPSAVDRDPAAPRPDSGLDGWKRAVTKLRAIVKPDPGQSNTGPNYGDYFNENDYGRVPRRDLPKEAPLAVGNGSGTRLTIGDNNNGRRPTPDDFRTLVWTDPKDPTKQINYVYLKGVFHPEMTTNQDGEPVKVNEKGVPIP